MKLLRILGYSIAAIAVIAVISTGFALWAYRDIPPATLESKYASRASRFINIDGTRLHYRDEGSGPAVLLLHSYFGNLIDWDPWVEALKDEYRVVRIDFTSHGLTDPDPRGDYSLERTLELTGKFINAMELDSFSIAGTSLGGTIAIHYANEHPNRIKNLILLQPNSQEWQFKYAISPEKLPVPAIVLTRITPRWLTEAQLKSGFGDKKNLTNELVDRWHDMWLRKGQREAQLERLKQFDAGDVDAVIRTSKPRTLLLWGEADPAIDFTQAIEIQSRFENVGSLSVISYPAVGRMVAQEAGQKTGRDVRAFLDQSRQADEGIPADTLK